MFGRLTIVQQVSAALALAPAVGAALGLAMIRPALAFALDDAQIAMLDHAVRAMQMVLLVTLACCMCAAIGAAILLRASIRGVVERIGDATEHIASGEFAHRIDSDRRDEFGMLARSIDAMAGRLHMLEEGRQRAYASVSHELRTPLTIIRGHLYSLSRAEMSPERRERIALIDSEAERLSVRIDDMLDAARLQHGVVELHCEPLRVRDIIDDVVARFAPQCESAGVAIRRSEGACGPLVARADRKRFEQVVDNLVANAVRHSPTGSVIDIACGASERGASMLEVRVSNCAELEASAYQPEAIESWFEPFVQAADRPGSLGLGLSVSRLIARAHDGDLVAHVDARRSGIASVHVTLSVPAFHVARQGRWERRRRGVARRPALWMSRTVPEGHR